MKKNKPRKLKMPESQVFLDIFAYFQNFWNLLTSIKQQQQQKLNIIQLPKYIWKISKYTSLSRSA